MYPPSIQKLIDLFSKFPTVGPRTASRFVFYLLKAPKEEIKELLKSILELRKLVKTCKLCLNPFQGEGALCKICSDPLRDRTLLCLVEKETDLISLEKTKKYKGLYFILGGTVPSFKKEGVKKLNIRELEERLKTSPEIQEVILAFNPTTEGETTALYLERILKPFGRHPPTALKITRLGRGLPVGGELEYADEETLSSALEGRK